MRKGRQDAFVSDRTSGGIVAELEHATLAAPADSLRIQLIADPQERRKQTLVITFGPHELKAPIVAQV